MPLRFFQGVDVLGTAFGSFTLGAQAAAKASGASAPSASTTPVLVSPATEASMRSAAVSFLASKLGLPYLWAGKDPAVGLDCSGAATTAYEFAGILPAGARNKYGSADLYCFLAHKDEADAKPGDLAFYGKEGAVSHVMVVADPGPADNVSGPRVIGASGGDRTVTTTEIARQKGAYVKYKPLHYRKDFVGIGAAPIGVAIQAPATPTPEAPVPEPAETNTGLWVALGGGLAALIGTVLLLVRRKGA